MMKKAMQLCFLGVFIGLIMFARIAPVYADEGNGVKILEPGKNAFGKSYNEWAQEWTNWSLQFPADESPILDPDGRFCDKGQKGKVWFLTSSFFGSGTITRECTIPYGKAIFLLLGELTISFKPEFPDPDGNAQCLERSSDIDQIRCDAIADFLNFSPQAHLPSTVLSVEINGVSVSDPFSYRVESPPDGFTMDIPEGSILNEFGLNAGERTPAVVEGYFIMLNSLVAFL